MILYTKIQTKILFKWKALIDLKGLKILKSQGITNFLD